MKKFKDTDCRDVYLRVEGDEVVEFECINPIINPDRHQHLWDEYRRYLRCTIKMNHFRCMQIADHSGECFSKELLFVLSGKKDWMKSIEYDDGKITE